MLALVKTRHLPCNGRRGRAAALITLTLAIACASATATAGAAVYPLTDGAERVAGSPGETIELLDFNGDGVLDIAGVTAQAAGGRIDLARGTTTGWAAEQTVTIPDVGGPLEALAASDITGDGRDDILAAFGGDGGTLAVLRGNASGTLALPSAGDVHPLGAAATSQQVGVDWGDVDDDGDVDVVTTVGLAPGEAGGKITVFLNDGSGNLTPTAQAFAIDRPADVLLLALGGDDGDGDLDLVVAQDQEGAAAVKVFPGADEATFGAGVDVSAGERADRLDFGDVDADGRLDVAVSHPAALELPTTILRGTAGAPGLGSPVDVDGAVTGHEVAVGDLDRDGRDDLFVADGADALDDADAPILLHSLGAFAFQRVDGPVGDDPIRLNPRVGDVDGDDKLDVVTSGSTQTVPNGYFIRYGLAAELVPSHGGSDFGLVAVGARSPITDSYYYFNRGPGAATAIRRSAQGAVADFPILLDTCSGATLQAGESCGLNFGFAPSAAGAREATFSMSAPDADFVNSLSLLGQGSSPPTPAATTSTPASAPAPRPAAAAVMRLGRPVFTSTTRRSFARRGLRFTQRLPAAGRASWTLEIPSARGRARVVVGRAKRTVTRAGVVRVTIRPSALGLRQVRRRKVRRLVLRTSFRTVGGAGALTQVASARLR